jgi:hypothetical protein
MMQHYSERMKNVSQGMVQGSEEDQGVYVGLWRQDAV